MPDQSRKRVWIVLFTLAISSAWGLRSASAQPGESANETLPEVLVTPGEGTEGRTSADSARYNGPTLYDYPFTSSVAPGYAADNITTGTKINVPLIDFPGSVGTVTRSTLDDQEIVNVEEAVHNVSSVNVSGDGAGLKDALIIRGFEFESNSPDFRKNGFRDSSRAQRDLANIERIEILKGPASVLYGSGEVAAGVINFITKKPLAYRYTDFAMRFGYWDNYRFTADVNGPGTTDGNSFYRINMAAQDSGSFRDFVGRDRFFIASVATYRLDSCTTLTLEMDWLYNRQTPDRGIPYYNGSFEDVPRSRFLGEPTDHSLVNDGQFGIFLNRRVNSCTSWRMGYVSNWSDETRNVVEPTGNKLSGDEVKRRVKDNHTVDSNHYFIADVFKEFSTWRLDHKVVFGTELGTNIRHADDWQANGTNINIFNPVYGQPQPTPNKYRRTDIQDDTYGIYMQDLIEITPRLKGLAGVRWDAYRGDSFDTNRKNNETLKNTDYAWSPRFGLVYQPIEDVFSIYAAYSNSFQPQTGVTKAGNPYIPEIGDLYEVGVKLEFYDGRLMMNVAGFDTFRKNVLVVDPSDTDYNIQVGQVESKGVEFDLVGQLTDRWSIIANCSHIDVRIIEDTDPTTLRNRLPNVPYFATSVWTRYNLVQNCCKTFGVATGVIYRGNREGTIDNDYILPSYARWDAAVYYRTGRLNFALVAENLLDEFYMVGGRSVSGNTPGAPFNIIGSVSATY